jgi:hypothetical protein
VGYGGARPGAGRPKGVPNRATAKREAEIAASGLTPLDYMLSLLRDETLDTETRFEAAKGAAPFVHPRLAAVEHSGEIAQPNVLRAPPQAKTAKDWSDGYAPKGPPLQ